MRPVQDEFAYIFPRETTCMSCGKTRPERPGKWTKRASQEISMITPEGDYAEFWVNEELVCPCCLAPNTQEHKLTCKYYFEENRGYDKEFEEKAVENDRSAG